MLIGDVSAVLLTGVQCFLLLLLLLLLLLAGVGAMLPSVVLVRSAPFCQHTMGFIGIDMHRCLPAPNHISIYNFAIASCQLCSVQLNHLF